MPDVVLIVGGDRYDGWQSIRVQRSIEQVYGSFSLGVSDRWAAAIPARAVAAGDACRIAIDDETVITGYVDDVTPHYSADSHDLTINGRDAAGDLVDCSAIHGAGQWTNQRLERIAADLCRPFGVAVTKDTDTGEAFAQFALQEGEAVYEALERLARQRGVLLVSDGLGNLTITRAGSVRLATELARGVNILEASGAFVMTDRYREITVKGQSALGDLDDAALANAAQGQARDPRVTRYRPLIVIAELQGGSKQYRERAQWDVNVRAGRGERFTVSVQGWTHPGGLWQPNRLVRLRDPEWLQVDADLLIVSVTLVLDDSGSRTELLLSRREAYDRLAIPDDKEALL